MNAQVIVAVLVTAAVCAVIGLVALLCQAASHSDDRAALLRGQLDAYRAGQASVLGPEQVPDDEPWPDPESVLLGDSEEDRFWSIAAELGYGKGEGL